jgi:hypothetical protein
MGKGGFGERGGRGGGRGGFRGGKTHWAMLPNDTMPNHSVLSVDLL